MSTCTNLNDSAAAAKVAGAVELPAMRTLVRISKRFIGD